MNTKISDEDLKKFYLGLPLIANAVVDKNIIDDKRIASILSYLGLEQDEMVLERVINFIKTSTEIYISTNLDKQQGIKKLVASGIPRIYAEPVIDILVILPLAVTNQAGTYFKNLYAELISKMSQFSSDDPSPNIQACLKLPNFVRAEMLARQHNLSPDILIACQELAIMQYVVDYRNVPGLKRLLQQFKVTPMELNRIFDLIKNEKSYPCFSFSAYTAKEGIGSGWESKYSPIEMDAKEWVVAEIKGWAEKWYGG